MNEGELDIEDGAHLDEFVASSAVDEPSMSSESCIQYKDEETQVDSVRECMSFEAFYGLFEYAFELPSAIDADFLPLKITDSKRPGATATARLTYDMLDRYFPSALRMPEKIADYGLAAYFIIGQITTARAIFAKKAEDYNMIARNDNDNNARNDNDKRGGEHVGE